MRPLDSGAVRQWGCERVGWAVMCSQLCIGNQVGLDEGDQDKQVSHWRKLTSGYLTWYISEDQVKVFYIAIGIILLEH